MYVLVRPHKLAGRSKLKRWSKMVAHYRYPQVLIFWYSAIWVVILPLAFLLKELWGDRSESQVISMQGKGCHTWTIETTVTTSAVSILQCAVKYWAKHGARGAEWSVNSCVPGSMVVHVTMGSIDEPGSQSDNLKPSAAGKVDIQVVTLIGVKGGLHVFAFRSCVQCTPSLLH